MDYGAYAQSIQVATNSAVIRNTVPDFPSQGHLSISKDSRKTVVQWVSGSKKPQTVQWTEGGQGGAGDRSPHYWKRQAKSTAVTYTAKDMCGGLAAGVGFRNPGYIHTATIEVGKKTKANSVIM